MGLSLLIAIILFFLTVLGISIYSLKRNDTKEDFFISGRRVNFLFIATTLAATEIGLGSSLGVYEKAYGEWGISSAWYVLTMSLAFIFISVISPRFRKTEVKTVPEYFRRRYGKASGLISAFIMLIPLLILALIQIMAAGKILEIFFNIDYKITVSIITLFIVSYCVIGGNSAIIRSNFFFIFFIVIGLMLVLPYSIRLCCDYPTAVKNLPYEKLNIFSGISIPTIISLVIMYIATFTIGQETASCFFSIKHSYHLRISSILTAMIMFSFAFIPSFLGVVTLSLENMGRFDSSIVFSSGVRYSLLLLIINYTPPFIVGTLLLSLISITISSADSDIFAIGSIFSNDIYKVFLDKNADDKQLIKIARMIMVMSGIVIYLLALFNKVSIITLLMFTFSFRAAGAFFPYIFGHYWLSSSSTGAIVSLIFGTGSYLAFEIINFSFLGFQPIVFALIISLISFIVFSKVYPPVINSIELIDEN